MNDDLPRTAQGRADGSQHDLTEAHLGWLLSMRNVDDAMRSVDDAMRSVDDAMRSVDDMFE